MIVLDTDHLGEFQKGTSVAAQRLRHRLDSTSEMVATTIVSIEEIMRGWLAAIHRQNDPAKQIPSYERLARLISNSASWRVLPWDANAVSEFQQLRAARLRLGTMDLKIASIVLANDAVLLSANLRDFEKVPKLQVEDWLHS